MAIEYRWAEGEAERLPELAADLVRRRVAVIVANQAAARAAKAVTNSVPIVFTTGIDPVRSGLVESFSRPGANVTGIVFTVGDLTAKRLGLLHELVPNSFVLAVLLDPNFAGAEGILSSIEEARRNIGRRIEITRAAAEHELDGAFETIVRTRAGALLVGGGPLFLGQRRQLVALAARHRLPASYTTREFIEIGGLMSYRPSQTEAYRKAGAYAARILKGAKPADLPVQQPTKLELVINLKTAKALGLDVPPSLLLRADEVKLVRLGT